LASDNPHAEEIEENLRFFLPVHLHDELVVLPSFEADPYRGLSPHPDLAARRAAGLWKLCRGFNGILITPATSLLSRLLSPDDFLSRCIRLEADSFFPRDFLISSLRSMGYVREDPVGSVGEFSFRGGIVDIFSPSGQYPVRIEFFGDEIETIREFDPATQRSINRLATGMRSGLRNRSKRSSSSPETVNFSTATSSCFRWWSSPSPACLITAVRRR